MRVWSVAATVGVLLTLASTGYAVGPSFYGDAPDDHHAWAVHDGNRPQPKVVEPGSFEVMVGGSSAEVQTVRLEVEND